jgi:hypothetical protein
MAVPQLLFRKVFPLTPHADENGRCGFILLVASTAGMAARIKANATTPARVAATHRFWYVLMLGISSPIALFSSATSRP